jgi:hypothetical protein
MTVRTDAILAQEFAAMPSGQVADTLNAQTAPGLGDAELLAAENLLLLSGTWGKLEYAAARGVDKEVSERAFNAIRLFTDPKISTIGYGDNPYVFPAVSAQMNDLVTDGLVDQSTCDAILAMATVQIPVWSPPFTDIEVNRTRGIPAVIQE